MEKEREGKRSRLCLEKGTECAVQGLQEEEPPDGPSEPGLGRKRQQSNEEQSNEANANRMKVVSPDSDPGMPRDSPHSASESPGPPQAALAHQVRALAIDNARMRVQLTKSNECKARAERELLEKAGLLRGVEEEARRKEGEVGRLSKVGAKDVL
jgi:hypothetical protein